MSRPYPPPNLPPQFEVESSTNGAAGDKNFDGYLVPEQFWRVVLEDDPGFNIAWIDQTDKPEYWIREHVTRTVANSYEEAKAHIEALAWLGELK